ncbi:ethanolamine ammonia-lyase light chain [Vibrio zhanjiangensis]|uniref:Ethanolamine ammonia-lyase small subunit n=1 Tax=Vibrio zhanjiangensis TaxID=1046128 RepID=A0ABQ6EUX4_9VIBR|nr:ethanolamine ammonia-lyase subunit EutC [Vibrio zhanjiangensis]GLT16973.1 ethanolamine ammonia-lyase light chain [Vibrio zhanjiangensis]
MDNRPEKSSDISQVTDNPWQSLRQFTSARIALGRAGNSIPTDEMLAFQLDHAKARDAVHRPLNIEQLVAQLCAKGTITNHTPCLPLVVNSKVSDRLIYLQRPDLGRQLDDVSMQKLINHRDSSKNSYDLSIVIADGLSSVAIQNHAAAVIERLISLLANDPKYSWTLAPITIVKQGRVACGDDVGECYKAKISLILIGERPGLTSPDSMGLYITWYPARGTQDSRRNCISNIRPEGLSYNKACEKAHYLLTESLQQQVSGVYLKDRSDHSDEYNLENNAPTHFLTSKK